MARLGQFARDESRDGLRNPPHFSHLHCAYFADNFNDDGLRGSTTGYELPRSLNHLLTLFLQLLTDILCSMALFGVVPDCLTLAPRHRCMTHSPAWIINPFNGKRIFGSGAEVGNTEMNPGGGDWTDYGSVGSSPRLLITK